MGLPDVTLKTASAFTTRVPFFRGLGRIYRMLNTAMVGLGANPIVSATMKDGTRMLVDLRTHAELDAYYRGEYDSALIGTIKSMLDMESYFLDVGANIGFYTVAIAAALRSRGGSGKVIAFEPLEENYKRLLENVTNNGLESYCSAMNIGLSSAAGDSEITLREDFLHGASTGNAAISINEKLDSNFKKVPVRLEPLDGVWSRLNDRGRGIDIIKIDIEGHEDFCLQGGQETIQANRPIILMEINKPYYVARGVELDDVFLPLIPECYSIFRRCRGKWETIGSLDECEIIDNIFIVPEERTERYKGVLSMS